MPMQNESSAPARLRRIAACAAAGQPLTEDDGRWLAERLDRYLATAADGARLDDALDLTPAPGDAGWWTVEGRARRDDLIRQIAARHCVGSVWQRATAIAEAARRYEGTAWPRERNAERPPAGAAGTMRELLFLAFKAHPRFPQSARQIRSIIEANDTTA